MNYTSQTARTEINQASEHASEVFAGRLRSHTDALWLSAGKNRILAVTGLPFRAPVAAKLLNDPTLYRLFEEGDEIKIWTKYDYFEVTGYRLYSWMQKKGTKVQFRLSGEEASTVEGSEKDAYRCSKAVKISIKQEAKASKVKLDAIKETLAIKNGYDYAIVFSEKEVPEIWDWITVLPYSTDGKAADREGNICYSKETGEYVPYKKCSESTASMFTSKKINSMSLAELIEDYCDWFEDNQQCYVCIRKSATEGKPASAYTMIKISTPASAPLITKKSNRIASVAKADDGKATDLTIPSIKNSVADKTNTYYEYLIVTKEDLEKHWENYWKNCAWENRRAGKIFDTIDFATAKWSKFVPGKTLSVGKTKSKYNFGTEKKETTLEKGSIVLIRRAADKKGGVVASKMIFTEIKETKLTVDGKQVDAYEWVISEDWE